MKSILSTNAQAHFYGALEPALIISPAQGHVKTRFKLLKSILQCLTETSTIFQLNRHFQKFNKNHEIDFSHENIDLRVIWYGPLQIMNIDSQMLSSDEVSLSKYFLKKKMWSIENKNNGSFHNCKNY